ncbi:MAG: calcineurin-like phosphoesterase C-terminal domain-containing protein [Alistipes sp.]|nr:calcineurin-like phosphoesterase C-terminal domain-containing protein [Alistipes sp.]
MNKLFITLTLLGAIAFGGCQEGLPMPPKPDKEQGKEDNDKDKGDNKDDEGKWEEPQQTIVNGTVIAEQTNLYGTVTNPVTGEPIPNIVVSDGFNCVITDSNGVYQIVRNENCEMVNISIPAEYEIPVDGGNQPAFYKRFVVDKDEKFRHDFTLKPLAGGKQSEFTLITLADIQLYDTNDADRFRDETMPDVDALAPTLVNPVAVTLGDDTGKNNTAMWVKVKQHCANRKVSIFHCMGNHDHLNELSPDDHSKATTYWKSVENFHKYFGPQNYSFSRSDTHIVVMDNALHGETPPPGEDYEYAAGFYDWQFEWLKQDLSYVPKDNMILLCLHIPFRDGKGGNHSDERYRQKVLNLLSEYKEARLLIGHTHKQINWIHTVNGKTIYEHIHGAVCGGMWHSTVCVDGTPNGYGVYKIKGNTLEDWYYKATGYDPEMQMRVYDGGQVFYDSRLNQSKSSKQNFFSKYSWSANGYIVANIWNIEHGDWDVSIWQNDKKVATMTKVAEREWWVAYWYLEVFCTTNDSYRGSTKHLYKGKLADKSAPFTVRAVDKSGKRKTMECSTLTTDFSEVWGDFVTKDDPNPIPACENEW